MTKVLFIINPISGTVKKNKLEEKIELYIDKSIEWEIIYTQAPKHATQITEENSSKFDIIAIAGGDGSINETFRGLINKSVALAVIPMGSGNGFARHLNIPLDIKGAIELINRGKIIKIDSVQINNEYFINVAGFGFDAYVAHLFANYGKRGFWSYVKIIFTKVFKYKPQNLNVEINGKNINSKDFIFSLANSSQYGNNARIAPKADLSDGLLDVVFQRKINIFNILPFLIKIMTGNLSENKNYKIYKAQTLNIKSSKEIIAHIDGDPINFNKQVEVKILEKSIKIVA